MAETDPLETWGESAIFMGMIYDEGVGLKPPRVLDEYWRTYLAVIEVVQRLVSRYPKDDPVDYDRIAEEAEYAVVVSRLDAIKEGLPQEVRRHIDFCF